MNENIWLYPTPAVQEYLRRRQRQGNDPFPQPETEREGIMHELWLIGVYVAGAWLEETAYLRDLLQKYQVTQAREAEKMHQEAAERVRRSLLLPQPTKQQLAGALKDVLDFNKKRRAGVRRLYQASGVSSLEEGQQT